MEYQASAGAWQGAGRIAASAGSGARPVRAACTSPGHDAVKRSPRTPAVRTQDCARDGVTAGMLLAPVRGHGREASLQSLCAGTPTSTRAPSYARRRPEETVLYTVVREELETFLARARERDHPVPRFVERELRAYLACGTLEHGFVRARCDQRLRPTGRLLVQGPRLLPLLRRAPHGRHRGSPRSCRGAAALWRRGPS